MRPNTLLAVLLVSPLLAAPIPAPKLAKKAIVLDGVWEVVERHNNGRRDDPPSPLRWTITGESVVQEMQTRTGFQRPPGMTYRLVKPVGGKENEIDFIVTPDDKDIPPSPFRGIFELDGDTLKVCRSHSPDQPRPAGCKPSEGANLYVFRQVKGK